jgi:hypothetical protein
VVIFWPIHAVRATGARVTVLRGAPLERRPARPHTHHPHSRAPAVSNMADFFVLATRQVFAIQTCHMYIRKIGEFRRFLSRKLPGTS